MFEAECPSCSASYQVDERRVPPTGLKMRCPKCGESFQVTAPGQSVPPVLGAALGISSDQEQKKAAPRPKHKATMLGVPEQASLAPKAAPPRPAGVPRPAATRASGAKNTMLGVAPAGKGFELASLEDDVVEELDDDELDLTAERPSDGSGLDLPSPSSGGKSKGLDLPSFGGKADELDLSAPSSAELPELPSAVEELGDELDLPSIGGEMDLPSPAAEIGLPAPAGSHEIGLPSPAPASVGLPDLSADLPDLGSDLPDLGGDLPGLGGDLPDLEASLPVVGGNLPEAAGALPEVSSGLPDNFGGLPGVQDNSPAIGGIDPFSDGEAGDSSELDFDNALDDGGGFDDGGMLLSDPAPAPPSDGEVASADDIFGKGTRTRPESLPPGEGAGAEVSAFGEVNLGGNDSGEADFGGSDAGDEDEFDAFPTETGPAESSGGGDYGDVALDGGSDSLDLGDDVERPAAPEAPPLGGPQAAASAQVELPGPASKSGKEKGKKGKKKDRIKASGLSKGARTALAATLIAAVGGGALALLPDVGPYGAYFIIDQVKAGDYRSHLARDIEIVQERLALDTSNEVVEAFRDVDRGRQRAPRFKERAAFAAHVGLLHQLRFGASSASSAEAQVILKGLQEAEVADVQYLDLARLTESAVTGKPEAALAQADSMIGRGLEYAVVIGEAALTASKVETAIKAWTAVLKLGATPRAHYGMARALLLEKKRDEALKHVETSLNKNPVHAGARLLLASMQVRGRDKDEEIVKSLTPLSEGKGASPGEQVEALVLLGNLHLARARIKKAESSYSAALAMDSGNARAQKGLAQTLFDSGRYSEALTRFEAAVASQPNDLNANLGLVQSKLRLEQLEDAVKVLDRLVVEHPKSSAVAYWVGRGKESIGEKKQAEDAYENAIKLDEETPELVKAYISLTRLLGQRGNLDEADAIIVQAEKKFPSDPAVYEALGELASNRGSFDDAVSDYDKALKLDPNNIGLRFSRGVALRQARRFDEAAAEFDSVEKESPDYPGLALERGNLYEASGQSEEALKAYEAALAAAPEDLDLMLRVACGKAGAGQSKEVIKLLEPVFEKRPNSAEVNFCRGLALLNAGEDLPSARRHLQRALNRDPSRAKHHLYVGWIALKMNDLPVAARALDEAIKLDRTLSDAYWKRGELRVKQKAVRDALRDLDRALELAPSRYEAHAQRAMAFMELGKEQEAMEAYAIAVAHEPVEAFIHYRYADLLLANARAEEAREQFELAVEKANKLKHRPMWLANAHRLLAMAIGRHPDAIEHLQVYMNAKQESDDPYLGEVLRELKILLSQQGH